VFGPETTTFFESGCALIVGTVASDGEPHATRGWGLTILDAGRTRLRLLLDRADETTFAFLRDTGKVAITACNVRTARSIQLKGTVDGFEPATDADRIRSADYTEAFFTDIEETDGTPRSRLERLRPLGLQVCLVDLADVFDQTPGPQAGTPLEGGAS